MTKTRPDLAALMLACVCVVGIVVLAVLHQPIPDVLSYLAVGALTGGAGAAFPGAGTTPAAAAALPAPRSSSDPVTGVFERIKA